MSHGVIHWEPTVVAKVPGERKYLHLKPDDEIDKHSPQNCSYWVESVVDWLARTYEGKAKIIRITMEGKLPT